MVFPTKSSIFFMMIRTRLFIKPGGTDKSVPYAHNGESPHVNQLKHLRIIFYLISSICLVTVSNFFFCKRLSFSLFPLYEIMKLL